MTEPENSLIQKLEKLVSFPSVSDDLEANEAVIKYCADHLARYIPSIKVLHSNDVPMLVASPHGKRNPRLLLQAHMDVVPASEHLFKLQESDGRLIGRGVFDMKFAAACYLQLVEDLKDEIDAYDFAIMLTADEELGGENGVGYLLDHGYSAGVCVLPDGGDEWRIEATCNALWIIRLTAKGMTAHGSRPWEGDNAIARMIKALDDIQNIFGEVERGKNTITISQINGGQAINQVPDYAEATVDMRFVDADQHESFKTTITSIIENHDLGLDVIADTAAGNIDMANPYIAEFLNVAERVRGKPLERNHSLGASDARFFAQKRIPTIIIRPDGGGHHSDNEWIDKTELLKFYEVLKTYFRETAKTA